MSHPRSCAVLGDPIEHSLSPVLHRAGYAASDLDWTYDAHRVPAGTLEEFVVGLGEQWRGLSLTMPLKREAMPLLASVTERGRLAGVVNTLVLDRDETGGLLLRGDNTDIPGAVNAVRERYAQPLRSATVLGGGATATSTALALVELGVTQIRLLVREPARAGETLTVLEGVPSLHVTVGRLDELSDAAPGDVVVSTIPAGAQSPALVAALASAPVLFDVIYDPWPTPLASAASGVVVSGLDLLVHQAALQFEQFTGLPAPLQAMREAGGEALAGRSAVARKESGA